MSWLIRWVSLLKLVWFNYNSCWSDGEAASIHQTEVSGVMRALVPARHFLCFIWMGCKTIKLCVLWCGHRRTQYFLEKGFTPVSLAWFGSYLLVSLPQCYVQYWLFASTSFTSLDHSFSKTLNHNCFIFGVGGVTTHQSTQYTYCKEKSFSLVFSVTMWQHFPLPHLVYFLRCYMLVTSPYKITLNSLHLAAPGLWNQACNVNRHGT